MIFGMCNIWVILRRNVIYFYSKNPHLGQLIVNIMRGFGRPANFKATRDLLTHKLKETHHVTVEVHNMAIS